jgi:hypothetical protein
VSWNLLLLLSPFFLFVLVFGVVVVVALTQAQEEDVPVVWRDCINVFCRLVHRVPTLPGAALPPDGPPATHHEGLNGPQEETL